MPTFVDSAHRVYADAPTATWEIATPNAASDPLRPGDFLMFLLAVDTDVTGLTVTAPGTNVLIPVQTPGSGTTRLGCAVLYHHSTTGEDQLWTFTLSAAADGGVVVLRFRDVDPAAPFAVSGGSDYAAAASNSAVNTKTAPSVVVAAADSLVVAGVHHRSGSHSLTTPSGHTLLDSTFTLGGRCVAGTARAGTLAANSAAGTVSFRTSSNGVGLAWQTALRHGQAPTGPPDPQGTLTYGLLGDVDTTTVRVSAKTAATATVRLVVARDAALTTEQIFGPATPPDAQGWSRHAVTGLTPGTDHWYAVEMTDAAGQVSTSTPTPFRTWDQGRHSFTFGFGSCLETGATNGAPFTRMLAREPSMFLHLGDYHYADSTSTTQATHLSHLEGQLGANAGLRDLQRRVATWAIPSDHDAGGGDDAMPGAYTAPNRAARLQAFAFPDRPNPDGLYWSKVRGSVRFIVTDHRYLRTSTSMMGATQEAWFKDQMTMPEPVKIWVQDSTWNTTEAAEPGGDSWSDYPANKASLGAWLADNAVGRVITVHGDQHAIAADAGVSGTRNYGVDSFCAAPFGKPASHKGGPWSAGRYPTSTGATVQQYGMVQVLDDGEQVTLTFTGYDSGDVARVSHTVTVDTTPAPASPWSLWSGGVEVPLTLAGIVEGGTLVPGDLTVHP